MLLPNSVFLIDILTITRYNFVNQMVVHYNL